ncbi:NEDD8-specific protease 1 [Ananas comosus]|uniref:NEDD8-specific protease 1 n=1 Tax=Ananas comosus TaxID=4615 RepID=A0A6P5G922_ANACO|nr:NEDD8-specific protease 1 [Ananas comosus]
MPPTISKPTTSTSAASSADDKILSYGDVVLRRSDLSILRGPHYLNDRLIDFFFAHLSSSFSGAGDILSGGGRGGDRLLLVSPSVAFWIANAPDAADAVEPLRLRDRDLALFAVNDNPDVALAEGGSHWSLLVYHAAAREFVHHDSGRGLNRGPAARLYGALKGFVGEGDDEARLVEGPTPQQGNGYDCGFFVLAIAMAVCDWYRKGRRDEEGERWFSDLRKDVDGNAARELRVSSKRAEGVVVFHRISRSLSPCRTAILDFWRRSMKSEVGRSVYEHRSSTFGGDR